MILGLTVLLMLVLFCTKLLLFGGGAKGGKVGGVSPGGSPCVNNPGGGKLLDDDDIVFNTGGIGDIDEGFVSPILFLFFRTSSQLYLIFYKADHIKFLGLRLPLRS